jgi:SnoaL-like protein
VNATRISAVAFVWWGADLNNLKAQDERSTKEEAVFWSARSRDPCGAGSLDQHWAASGANDFETEHRIYHEDVVLEYPQSGERTRGRRDIQNQRASQPSKKRFAVRRIIGGGDLWITELILTYDGKRPTP